MSASWSDADIWEKLEAAPVQEENIVADRYSEDESERLLAGVDSKGHRHLLVGLLSSENDMEDVSSRGLSIRTRSLNFRGQGVSRYIDIECNDPTRNQMLHSIGRELSSDLKGSQAKPAEIVRKVISKWRRFWSAVPKKLLSREELIGLLAEIWFLWRWLVPAVGATKALKSWLGPSGNIHDFVLEASSIEVKATTSGAGAIHRINGIDQLVPPKGGSLYFFSVRLSEGTLRGITLPSVIGEVMKGLDGSPQEVSSFESKLVQAGYSPLHEEDYNLLGFRLTSENMYEVNDEFPKLVGKDFRSGALSGIERIEYDINLSGFQDLIVAKTPEEFAKLGL